jgi:magnesium-transporting ATPase (P-type)
LDQLSLEAVLAIACMALFFIVPYVGWYLFCFPIFKKLLSEFLARFLAHLTAFFYLGFSIAVNDVSFAFFSLHKSHSNWAWVFPVILIALPWVLWALGKIKFRHR